MSRGEIRTNTSFGWQSQSEGAAHESRQPCTGDRSAALKNLLPIDSDDVGTRAFGGCLFDDTIFGPTMTIENASKGTTIHRGVCLWGEIIKTDRIVVSRGVRGKIIKWKRSDSIPPETPRRHHSASCSW